ncbi:TPA: hypothetical protein TY296_000144 [Streptococcus suis]|nr:hypothetical protein [Streptococcus suis]
MKNTFIMIERYFPDVTASGNLIMNLVPYFQQDGGVTILATGKASGEELDGGVIRFPIEKNVGILDKVLAKCQRKPIVYNLKMAQFLVGCLKDNQSISLIPVTIGELALAVQLKKDYAQQVAVYPFLLEELLIGYDKKQKEILKEEILTYSDAIFVLPKLKDYFQDTEKVVIVEHPMVRNCVNPQPSQEKRVIYAGGLNRSTRNPENIIQAFSDLDLPGIDLVFYSYGNYQKQLAKWATSFQRFHSKGAVNSEVAMAELMNASIILTIGNRNSNLVPSKLFDCISTGNPIVHFYYETTDPYISYLKEYPHALCLDINAIDYHQLREFVEHKAGQKVEYSIIQKKFEATTPEFVYKQMQAVMGNES